MRLIASKKTEKGYVDVDIAYFNQFADLIIKVYWEDGKLRFFWSPVSLNCDFFDENTSFSYIYSENDLKPIKGLDGCLGLKIKYMKNVFFELNGVDLEIKKGVFSLIYAKDSTVIADSLENVKIFKTKNSNIEFKKCYNIDFIEVGK